MKATAFEQILFFIFQTFDRPSTSHHHHHSHSQSSSKDQFKKRSHSVMESSSSGSSGLIIPDALARKKLKLDNKGPPESVRKRFQQQR